jgi:hypothetical protein
MRFSEAPRKLYAVAIAVLLACVGLNAQTAPALQTYSAEVTVPLSQVGAFPPASIPPADLQAIQGGALEIRHSVVFTASTRRLSVRTFLVAPGSPNPTPPVAQDRLHESYEVNVENVLWAPVSAVPPGTTDTLVITGRIAGGSLSVAGNIANRIFIHSVGFDPATRMDLTNITSVVAGRDVLYATQGRGMIGFGGTGDGGNGNGEDELTVTASAGNNSTTALPEITLSALVEHASGMVTYSWRSVGKSAAVIDPTTSTPRVQFGEGFGDYMFQVTVTDNTGATATSQVRVMYVGR